MKTKLFRAADLFCGAGGTSEGLALACEQSEMKVDLLAVNHWTVAVETHKRNHPWARHLCKSLHEVNPKEAVPEGRLDLLIAAPECTHHSVARGGRPVNDQMRMSAFLVLDWLSVLYVDSVLIENVREFREWGPLGANQRPLKSKRGEIYAAFITSLKALGYKVEQRILNAADYGDPTTRERLFIIGRRSKKISWPSRSHCPSGLLGKKWRSAREIIDWSIESQSIFTRKRPLSDNTIARIAAGLKRFGGISFVVDLRGTRERHLKARSIDEPLPTLTTSGHVGVVEPFILPHRTFKNMFVDSVDRPIRTITAQSADHALVQPFLSRYTGNHRGKTDGTRRNKSVDEPIGTLDTSNRFALVEPFIVPFFGERATQEPRTHSINEPLPAVTGHGAGALAEPFLVTVNHGQGQARRSHSIERPAPTLTTKNGLGLCESFLVKYNGTGGGARSIDKPLDTITTKDRFGLVEYPIVEIGGEVYALDIHFRMLRPQELAAAMGFPKSYRFIGTQDQQVKQIGNAVAVNTAKALCGEFLKGTA